jgi:hypothetical protein
VRSIVLPSWIERAAGLEPRTIPPHAFELSRDELAYAAFSPGEAAADASAFRTLLEAQSVTLPGGLFGEGPLGVPVGDSASFAAAVRMLTGRLSRAPKEAALVLPDAWVRGLMIDSAELPDEPAARREVLRFRLKRLVPFRTEDLRVAAVPLGAGAAVVESEGGNGSSVRNDRRAFANLANESLLEVVESGFTAAGVRIGWISGVTAALHAGLTGAFAPASVDETDAETILGLAHVDSDGFTFVVSRDGEPVVWRQKNFTAGLADFDRERLLTAELRLTRTFLEDRLPGRTMGALFLSAPAVVEPFWNRVLHEGLGVAPLRLRPEHVGFAGGPLEGGTDSGLLALAGAVARKVG